jgi:hypothetical protein
MLAEAQFHPQSTRKAREKALDVKQSLRCNGQTLPLDFGLKEEIENVGF